MNNKKLTFFKDPVHGEINFYPNDAWFIDLINTPEFQRLTRIRQLGVSFCIFPSATHTRFAHSLGVFEMTRRFLEHLNVTTTAKERKALLCAALLHDVGHGPNSHSFEKYTGIKHEEYTKKIIGDPKGGIAKVFHKNKVSPEEVIALIDKKHPKQWMNELISSQIDADRIDYLLRDSHYTGATYGLIDISIIAKRISVENGKLVYLTKAISAVENFLTGRYHMYEQVYSHKQSLSYERIIENIFRRVKELHKKKHTFVNANNLMFLIEPWLHDEPYTVEQFLHLDDFTFHSLIISWRSEKDAILKMLLEAYENPRNFITKSYDQKTYEKCLLKCKKEKLEAKYYCDVIDAKHACIYDPKHQPILMYDEATKKTKNIASLSNILKKTTSQRSIKKLLLINKMVYIK